MQSNNVTVVGLQWGDEGKGKIVDALASSSSFVVRYSGGANAGHSMLVDGRKFAMHLIPCGILHEGVCNVIANGVAFDPVAATEELAFLRGCGIAVGPDKLLISSASNVVMPWHKLADSLSEKYLGSSRLGTTARGIGPCYCDKAARSTAIRTGALARPDMLRKKVVRIAALKNKMLVALYDAEPLDAEAIADQYVALGRQLAPMIRDTGAVLRRADAEGKRIIFEGSQGSMLDIDHGTYPFVTSSVVTACGVPPGAGVPPSVVGRVVGLIKAYTSRVGAGPFATEQDNETGEYLRERGKEYGTTTGRPRRCGWFDAFAIGYAADISGVNELALSLLDVLSGLKELKICTGYRIGDQRLDSFDPVVMADARCVYETLPGWDADITGCRTFGALPDAAQNYINRIEQLIGRPVGLISVGPDRTQTIRYKTQIQGLE